MMIHDITSKAGRYPTRKRCGRGEGSGLGGTSGRGHKGAKSRSGWARRPGYEGGQVPLQRRIPKRGFSNANFRTLYAVVNVKTLQQLCKDGDEVTAQSLAQAGVIRDASLPLKVLGEGDLTRKISVTAAKYSQSAKAKIESAGGTAAIAQRQAAARPEGAPAAQHKAPSPAKSRSKPKAD